MEILVVSDTHGDYVTFDKLVRSKPKAEVVIHCGDGSDDFDIVKKSYPDKMFIGVRGNCDWGCDKPYTEIRTIESKKFFITHGHLQSVKYGLGGLKAAAHEEKADIVLFGHTHEAHIEYDDGVWIMNPGSLLRYGCSYGLIEIQKGQVLMNTANFKL